MNADTFFGDKQRGYPKNFEPQIHTDEFWKSNPYQRPSDVIGGQVAKIKLAADIDLINADKVFSFEINRIICVHLCESVVKSCGGGCARFVLHLFETTRISSAFI